MLEFTPSPDRFLVEELPAYPPAGQGAHTFLWLEKRGLTTFDAIARIAAAFGVAARDVGYAGMKDKHATTRQWLSVPDLDPERALTTPLGTLKGSPNPPAELRGEQSSPAPHAIAGDDLRVLEAARHPHKLRLGHLRGNRFEVVLTGAASDEEIAALRGRFDDLAARGVPNFYGEQRFGVANSNAARGLELLRGARQERDKRKRRLLLSAIQSAVFNRALELRATRGPLTEVIPGDVLKKTDTGGLFVSTEPSVDQPRVDAGEVIPTLPLPGGREIEPPPGTAARALEDEAIAAVGATREDFTRAGRELPGARRPVLLRLADPAFCEEAAPTPNARAVRLRFTLPAGSYATVVVASVTSPPR
ncbi:MAG TPA: tRNA pseudouridine(13) synthase TruD [Polyangia bacterium]